MLQWLLWWIEVHLSLCFQILKLAVSISYFHECSLYALSNYPGGMKHNNQRVMQWILRGKVKGGSQNHLQNFLSVRLTPCQSLKKHKQRWNLVIWSGTSCLASKTYPPCKTSNTGKGRWSLRGKEPSAFIRKWRLVFLAYCHWVTLSLIADC